MHRWPFLATALLCTLLSSSCRKDGGRTGASPDPAQVGTSYSLNDGEGGFRVGKVIAAEDGVVFVHWFMTRWTSRPTLAQAHEATKAASIAFSPETFAGMQPVRLENGTVSPEESEAYEKWKQSPRDIF